MPAKSGGHSEQGLLRHPAIRTMGQDLAALGALDRPLRIRPAVSRKLLPRLRIHVAAFTLILAAALVAGVIAGFEFLGGQPTPPQPLIRPPESSVPYDGHIGYEIGASRAELASALDQARQGAAPGERLERILVELRPTGGGARLLDLATFFQLLETDSIAGLASRPPELFRSRSPAGARLGIIFGVEDQDRLRTELARREPSLAQELSLLLPQGLDGIPAPFQDRTYRNTDLRFQPLSPSEDLGIGYFFFPGRRLAVLGTSEAGLKEIIDRLFQTR